jgi:outer membrane autotransporter protein
VQHKPAPIAHDAAVLELGVDMAVSRHTTVGVSYNGEFGAGNQLNAGMLDVKYRF